MNSSIFHTVHLDPQCYQNTFSFDIFSPKAVMSVNSTSLSEEERRKQNI